MPKPEKMPKDWAEWQGQASSDDERRNGPIWSPGDPPGLYVPNPVFHPYVGVVAPDPNKPHDATNQPRFFTTRAQMDVMETMFATGKSPDGIVRIPAYAASPKKYAIDPYAYYHVVWAKNQKNEEGEDLIPYSECSPRQYWKLCLQNTRNIPFSFIPLEMLGTDAPYLSKPWKARPHLVAKFVEDWIAQCASEGLDPDFSVLSAAAFSHCPSNPRNPNFAVAANAVYYKLGNAFRKAMAVKAGQSLHSALLKCSDPKRGGFANYYEAYKFYRTYGILGPTEAESHLLVFGGKDASGKEVPPELCENDDQILEVLSANADPVTTVPSTIRRPPEVAVDVANGHDGDRVRAETYDVIQKTYSQRDFFDAVLWMRQQGHVVPKEVLSRLGAEMVADVESQPGFAEGDKFRLYSEALELMKDAGFRDTASEELFKAKLSEVRDREAEGLPEGGQSFIEYAEQLERESWEQDIPISPKLQNRIDVYRAIGHIMTWGHIRESSKMSTWHRELAGNLPISDQTTQHKPKELQTRQTGAYRVPLALDAPPTFWVALAQSLIDMLNGTLIQSKITSFQDMLHMSPSLTGPLADRFREIATDLQKKYGISRTLTFKALNELLTEEGIAARVDDLGDPDAMNRSLETLGQERKGWETLDDADWDETVRGRAFAYKMLFGDGVVGGDWERHSPTDFPQGADLIEFIHSAKAPGFGMQNQSGLNTSHNLLDMFLTETEPSALTDAQGNEYDHVSWGGRRMWTGRHEPLAAFREWAVRRGVPAWMWPDMEKILVDRYSDQHQGLLPALGHMRFRDTDGTPGQGETLGTSDFRAPWAKSTQWQKTEANLHPHNQGTLPSYGAMSTSYSTKAGEQHLSKNDPTISGEINIILQRFKTQVVPGAIARPEHQVELSKGWPINLIREWLEWAPAQFENQVIGAKNDDGSHHYPPEIHRFPRHDRDASGTVLPDIRETAYHGVSEAAKAMAEYYAACPYLREGFSDIPGHMGVYCYVKPDGPYHVTTADGPQERRPYNPPFSVGTGLGTLTTEGMDPQRVSPVYRMLHGRLMQSRRRLPHRGRDWGFNSPYEVACWLYLGDPDRFTEWVPTFAFAQRVARGAPGPQPGQSGMPRPVTDEPVVPAPPDAGGGASLLEHSVSEDQIERFKRLREERQRRKPFGMGGMR